MIFCNEACVLVGSYYIFIVIVREEKITWSYGSVLYVHLYSLGAKLWQRSFRNREYTVQISLLSQSSQCTFNSSEKISESCEFEVG